MLFRRTQCSYRSEASFSGSEGAQLLPHAGTRLADAVYLLPNFVHEDFRNWPYTANLDELNSRHLSCETWPLDITHWTWHSFAGMSSINAILLPDSDCLASGL